MSKEKAYWDRIKKNYPQAFGNLIKSHNTIEAWGEIDSPLIWGEFINEPKWVLRHLFDFFDSYKISAYCYPSNKGKWHYAIIIDGRRAIGSIKIYTNRSLAELSVYKECFSVLEKILKQFNN